MSFVFAVLLTLLTMAPGYASKAGQASVKSKEVKTKSAAHNKAAKTSAAKKRRTTSARKSARRRKTAAASKNKVSRKHRRLVKRRRPSKRPVKRASKSRAKRRPHLTPAYAPGIRKARPGSLRAMSIGVLEKNSLVQRRALHRFARRHHAEVEGALAYFVLGYGAYLRKKYPEAKTYLEASRRVPSPIRDYPQYFLAMTEVAQHNYAAARRVLGGFARKHPSSPLAAPATVQEAKVLLAMNRPSAAVPLLVSPPVPLPAATATLLLGEAYQKDRRRVKAAHMFQKVYFLYATSPEASDANKELRHLRAALGRSYPEPTEKMRIARAKSLFAAGEWRAAEREYRRLASIGPLAARQQARVRAEICRYRAGRVRAALANLRRMRLTDPEANAERLSAMVAIYRRLGRADDMDREVQLLAQSHADADSYQKALFLAGNYYLTNDDPAHASEYYQTLYEHFPRGEYAAASHWRVAWQRYRERNLPEARRLFEEYIRNYPSGPQISAAIYWLGRTIEPDSPAAAAVYYRKLVETFPNYYYGGLARERLAKIAKLITASDDPDNSSLVLLASVRRPSPEAALEEKSLSSAARRHQRRAKLLASAWLIDLAIDELKAGIGKDSFHSPLGREMVLLEQERGRYNVALQYAKQLLEGYLTFDMENLSRQDWELLFPLPWWRDIKARAKAMKLDPYLVAGLIRQESEFNPKARSHSNARGLMQLLPATARRMARQMSRRRRRFRLSSLNSPRLNVAYGTFYLHQVLEQFDGSLQEALAAYNAGENHVVDWLQAGNYEDPPEFVESIPFTETREYVQAVMRNAALYHKLYLGENSRAAWDGFSEGGTWKVTFRSARQTADETAR